MFLHALRGEAIASLAQPPLLKSTSLSPVNIVKSMFPDTGLGTIFRIDRLRSKVPLVAGLRTDPVAAGANGRSLLRFDFTTTNHFVGGGLASLVAINALLLTCPDPGNQLDLAVRLCVPVPPAELVGVGHQLVTEIAIVSVAEPKWTA